MKNQRKRALSNGSCKYCGASNHTSIMCWRKPRLPIKKESDKHRNKRQQTKRQWLKENPPSPKGTWTCYLQISPMCPRVLTASTLTIEHVKPKGSNPKLKHDLDNLRPACQPCNLEKGSRSLESLGLT